MRIFLWLCLCLKVSGLVGHTVEYYLALQYPGLPFLMSREATKYK
jgi:hypothetical protein